MRILGLLYWFFNRAVGLGIVAVIALLLLRLLVNLANPNPFGWTSLTVRRLTDPLVSPMRRWLARFGVDPKYAPLVTILLTILFGWFALQLVASLASAIAGILLSVEVRAVVPFIGYLLYWLLAFYSFLIFIRIILSWGTAGYGNRLVRFLINATEPMLGPLRRRVPPVSGLDISPLVAFLIIWLLQAAVAGTLLRGWPIVFFA